MAQPKRILLVDDDVDDQWFFKRAIHEIDTSITLDVVGNGLEALAMLHKGATLPDIIFMDVNMPGMDGLDCLRHLKASERFKTIPVVLLTTSDSEDEQKLAGKLGASMFITKPTFYDVLKQNITTVLQSSLLQQLP